MRLLCISDIHGALRALVRILSAEPPADVLILAGDLTDFGTPRDASAVVKIARDHSPQVLAVAGNCDSAEIDAWLAAEGISVHARGLRLGGCAFCGLSAMPPWRGNMYEFPESELDRSLAAGMAQVGGEQPLVLVSHAPPYDCGLDRSGAGAAVGSTSVRKWIEKVRPALVVCGHIHESGGIAKLGTSMVVNCAPGREGVYAVAELNGQAVKIELRRVRGV